MQLIEVNSPALALKFHEVPFNLYKSDPLWIPALRQDVEKLFDPKKNKLFKEGAKAIRWILEDEKGKLVGRIAAFVNPRVLIPGKMQAGGMGFFDCIDNKEAANLLLTAAKDWLQKLGMEAMDGPINLGDRQQFWGCQVTNWEEPPIYPMNYNPPYAHQLLENYGFDVYFKQFLYHRIVNVPAQPVFYRKVALLKRIPDLRVTDIRGVPLEKVAADFRSIYNGGWSGHSHFKELSQEAALKIMKVMKPAIDPDIIFFVYQKEVPLAFFINLPELNQIFRHVNGNMNWLGKLKFLYHKWKKTPTRMTGIVFGVVREWHGKGLEALMIVHSEKAVPLKGQYHDTVLSWIGDFNPKMIHVAENLGASLWRQYHTYRYQFDRNIPFERAPIVE